MIFKGMKAIKGRGKRLEKKKKTSKCRECGEDCYPDDPLCQHCASLVHKEIPDPKHTT